MWGVSTVVSSSNARISSTFGVGSGGQSPVDETSMSVSWSLAGYGTEFFPLSSHGTVSVAAAMVGGPSGSLSFGCSWPQGWGRQSLPYLLGCDLSRLGNRQACRGGIPSGALTGVVAAHCWGVRLLRLIRFHVKTVAPYKDMANIKCGEMHNIN